MCMCLTLSSFSIFCFFFTVTLWCFVLQDRQHQLSPALFLYRTLKRGGQRNNFRRTTANQFPFSYIVHINVLLPYISTILVIYGTVINKTYVSFFGLILISFALNVMKSAIRENKKVKKILITCYC
jgi:hypothetical protein